MFARRRLVWKIEPFQSAWRAEAGEALCTPIASPAGAAPRQVVTPTNGPDRYLHCAAHVSIHYMLYFCCRRLPTALALARNDDATRILPSGALGSANTQHEIRASTRQAVHDMRAKPWRQRRMCIYGGSCGRLPQFTERRKPQREGASTTTQIHRVSHVVPFSPNSSS
jgi:hypothetical protein